MISSQNHYRAASSENFVILYLMSTMEIGRLGHRSVLEHLVRPRSHGLSQMVLQYALHLRHPCHVRMHNHVRMHRWLLTVGATASGGTGSLVRSHRSEVKFRRSC